MTTITRKTVVYADSTDPRSNLLQNLLDPAGYQLNLVSGPLLPPMGDTVVNFLTPRFLANPAMLFELGTMLERYRCKMVFCYDPADFDEDPAARAQMEQIIQILESHSIYVLPSVEDLIAFI